MTHDDPDGNRRPNVEPVREATPKRCTACGEVKPREEFPRDCWRRDGRRAACKACTNQRQRERYGGSRLGSEDFRFNKLQFWIDQAGREPYWTDPEHGRERIVAALRRDAARRGRAPTVTEWDRRRHRVEEHPGPAEKLHRRPTRTTVRRVFGSWAAALAAADLERPPRQPRRKRCFSGRHLLTPDNIAVYRDRSKPNGYRRECRACSQERRRRRYATTGT